MAKPWEQPKKDSPKPWERPKNNFAAEQQPENGFSPIEALDIGTSRALEAIPVLGSYYPDLREAVTGETPESFEQRAQKYPLASAAGALSSIAAQMAAIPATTVTRGSAVAADLAKRLGISAENAARLLRIEQAGLTGATIGGLSKADTSEERLANIGAGAAWSAGPAAFLEGLQGLLGGRKGAELAAFKSTRPNPTEMAEYTAKQDAAEAIRASGGTPAPSIGATLLDEGVLGSGMSVPSRETMRKGVGVAKERAGEQIGNVVKLADEAAGGYPVIGRQSIQDRVRGLIKLDPKDRAFDEEYTKLQKELQRMMEGGDLSIAEAQALKQRIQDRINFDKSVNTLPREPISAQVDRAERLALAEALDKEVASRVQGGEAAYTKAKGNYANLSDVEDIINRAVAQDEAGFSRFGTVIPGLGIYGAAAIAENLMGGKTSFALPLAAITTGGLATSKYGPQIRARFLNKQANPLSSALLGTSIWQSMKTDKEESK